MKYLAVIMIILQFSWGQKTQEGIPYSYNHDLKASPEVILLPMVDEDALLVEDSHKESGTPYRYGYIHDGNYSTNNSGIWMEANDGTFIWQIHFKSTGAHALSFDFDNFHKKNLPPKFFDFIKKTLKKPRCESAGFN